jgi:hypothetical protein
MSIRDALVVINRMQDDGIIEHYAIGGAIGATFYLEAVATVDLDVFITIRAGPSSPIVSLSAIFDYLAGKGCGTDGEHIVIAGWPVLFLPAAGPLLEEALAEARLFDVEGVSISVFSAEHLAAIALQTGRAKDKARLVDFIEAQVLDTDRLKGVLTRHGLMDQWRRYERIVG